MIDDRLVMINYSMKITTNWVTANQLGSESVYIKTQNPVLCKQKEFMFSLGLFNQRVVKRCTLANHMANWTQYSLYHVNPSASGYIFRLTFQSLSNVSYSDECGRKSTFQYAKRMFPLFRAIVKFCSANRLFNWILHSGC